MRRLVWLMLLPALAIVLAGCSSGDGGGPINIVRNGSIRSSDIELGDGSFADLVRFRATRDGVIRVLMDRAGSNPVDDPYIQVFEGSAFDLDDLTRLFNQGFLVDSDDDSGSGVNALLEFIADGNVTYTAVLNTSGPNDFGDYSFQIRELTNVAAAGAVPMADAGDKPAGAADASKAGK